MVSYPRRQMASVVAVGLEGGPLSLVSLYEANLNKEVVALFKKTENNGHRVPPC
jgi:hypothetical protein